MFIINSVLAYFFYRYAFVNPDEDSCFASHVPGTTSASQTEQGDFTIDVSKEFETWFTQGFNLSCSALAYYLLTFMNFKCCGRGRLIGELVTALGYFAVLGTLIWLVLGSLLRWSYRGVACSDPAYLEKSGKFMMVYLFAMYAIVGLTFMCTIGSSIKETCDARFKRSHAHFK